MLPGASIEEQSDEAISERLILTYEIAALAAPGCFYGHSPGQPLDPGYARNFSCLTRHLYIPVHHPCTSSLYIVLVHRARNDIT